MPKDVIGTAYVRIAAMSADFEKQVQASFDRLKPMAAKSGEESSKAWTDGFEKHFGQVMADAQERVQQDIADSWRDAGTEHGVNYGEAFGEGSGNQILDDHAAIVGDMGDSWSAAGAEHGRGYGDPFSVEVDRAMGRSVDNSTNLWRDSNLMRFPLADLNKLADDMPNILGRGADNSGSSLQSKFSNVFSNIGRSISTTFSDLFGGGGGGGKIFKSLTDGADEASQKFTMLFSIGQLVGGAIVAAIGAVANLASGLFALASAAGQAAPALAVLPGLISAIAQAGGTVLLGFKGIGKAIQDGLKLASPTLNGAAGASRSLASAQRAVQAAQRSVAASARALDQAEKNATKTKRDLKDAQKALNDSYKEGARQIRDIQYAAEDAVLGEERAALNLADARDNLAEVKANNPADSRAVQEAELAYKEADLAYREARSRQKDSTEAANEATKKGVKGSDAVVSAQERLVNAQEAAANATQRVADAQQSLADAQQRLADAQKGVASGGAAATAAQDAYNAALKKFGPNGQAFIKKIVSLREQFSGLKKVAGEGFFDNLNAAVTRFAGGPGFKILKKNLGETSVAVGDVITRFTNMALSGENLSSIDRIMQSNTVVIGEAGKVATNLGQAFISITDAARPMTQEFAKWIAKVTEGWAGTLKAKNASGELADTFDKAARVAKQLGRIFGNVFGAIFATGKAATSGGNLILNWIESATEKWETWTKTTGGQNTLKKYFEDVAQNFGPIIEGVVAIGKELLKLGADKQLTGGVADVLKTIASVIGPVGKAVSAAAPLFSKLAANIALIFKALQESPALSFFIGTLEKISGGIAKALTFLTGNETGRQVLFFAGAIMGVVRALRFLQVGFGFILKGTVGKTIKNVAGAFGGIKSVFKGENPFKGMIDGSKNARDELKKQMKVDALKKEALKDVEDAARKAGKGMHEMTDESKKSRGAKILDRIKNVGKPLPVGQREKPKTSLRSRVGGVGKKVGKGLAIGGAALGGVGLAIGALVGVASLNKDSAAALGKQINDMVKNLPVALSALASQLPGIISSIAGAIGPVIQSITAALPGVIQAIIGALPTILAAISDALPKVLNALLGALPVIIGAITKLLPALIQTLVKLVPILLDAIVKAFPVIIKALAGALPVIIKALAEAIPEIITSLVDAIPEVITAIVDAIPVIITALVDAIPIIIKALIDAIPEIIGAIIAAIPQIISALIKAVPQIISAVISAVPAIIGSVISLFPDVFQDIFKAAWDNLVALWNGLTAFFTGIWNAVSAVFEFYWNTYKAIFTAAWNALKFVWDAVVTYFQTLWTTVTNVIKFAWNAVTTVFTNAWNRLTQVWGAVASWFQTRWDNLRNNVARVAEWLATPFQNAWNKITEVWGGVVGWFREKINLVVGAFSNIKERMGGVLSGVWNTLKTGFVTVLNWVIDKWNGLRFPSISIPGTDFSSPDRLPYIDPIRLANGGVVAAVAGGVNALIGEAGQSEVVKPLDGKGHTASDRMILALLQAQGKMLSQIMANVSAAKLVPTVAAASVAASQRAASAQNRAGAGSSDRDLLIAVNALTASVAALQKPLVGGDLTVVAPPGENATETLPRILRRRSYIQTGAQ